MEAKILYSLKDFVKSFQNKAFVLLLSFFALNNAFATLPSGAVVNSSNKLKVQEYNPTTHSFIIQLFCIEDNDQDDSWSDDAGNEPHILKINGITIATLKFKIDDDANGRIDYPECWFDPAIGHTTIGTEGSTDVIMVFTVPDSFFNAGTNTITFDGVWKERVSGEDDVWSNEYLTVNQYFPGYPGAPTGVTSSFDEYGDVHITWSPPMNGSYDAVNTYRGTNLLNTFSSSTTSAVDENYHYGDQLGIQYQYTWVDAIINGGSVVLKGDIVYTQPGDPPTPSAPTNVQATQDRCDSIIKITWDYFDSEVPDAEFIIYADGNPITSTFLPSSTRSYEHYVGDQYVSKQYEVKAAAPYNYVVGSQAYYRNLQFSPPSNTVTGETYGIPDAPTNLTATINSDYSITLNWTPGVLGQEEIYIKKVSANNTVTIDDIDPGQSSYTDENVPPCVTLSYTVCVKNSCVEQAVTSNTVTVRITPDITYNFDYSHKLKCSKGYYNDKVRLSWQYNNTSEIERFKIYRREINSSDTLLVATISPTTSYDDYTAQPGVYYEYYIVGEYDCENDIVKTPINSYSTDFGFRTEYATVSGNVSYAGGNGVEGVVVVAETDDLFPANSLMLNGSNSYIRIPNNSFDFSENFTFSAWVRPNSVNQQVIFQKGSQYRILHQLNKIIFEAGTQTLYLNFPEKVDTFFNVSAVRDPDSLYIYVIYDQQTVYKASAERVSATPQNSNDIYIGSSSNAFTGWIEDIRIWERSFDQQHLVFDNIRYLSGNEQGLKVYYHLDQVYNNRVFDISRNGSYYNENHGYIYNCQLSPIVPFKQQQLGTKGITDANGNYIISNIPYTVGSVYMITPIYGLHEFDPNQTQLYIGPGSNNHSNIDFTDIAAFRVTGNVKYYGTNFPVKGVSLYIDGTIVTREDGTVVTTDEYGNYEIYVPIGWHNISVGKVGHVFVDNGQFPTSGNYNFTQPLTGVDFIDSTLVKVIGRCAGGPIEQEKKMGLGRTNNNIGNATILLTTQKQYPLTDNPNGVSGIWDNSYYQDGQINTYGTTNYTISSASPDYITIYPDTSTGEFVAYLLPEKYVINSITAGEYTYDNSYLTTLDLTNVSSIQMTEIDSVITGFYLTTQGDTAYDYQIDSVNYNQKLDLILRIPPSIDVTRADGNQFLGEEQYVTRMGDTLSLVNSDGTLKTAYPVFLQRKRYDLLISVFENYHNQDNGTYDTVPVKDGLIEIVNNLAIDRNLQVYEIDQDGHVLYSFKGGLPNITQGGIGDYLLTMSIVARTGQNHSIFTEWLPNNEPFKGYILGGMPTGNNFVTTGPNEIVTILRDPPGSDSYSYLEEGTELVTTTTMEVGNDLTVNQNITFDFGSKVTTLTGGIGGGIIQENEQIANTTVGLDMSFSWLSNNTTTNVTTNTQRWQTSQGPDYVGSGGDLFIGYSTNIVYGISRQIDILPVTFSNAQDFVGHPFIENNVTYDIGKVNGIRMNPEFNTAFQYSLNHIENYILPNLEMLRNKFLLEDTNIYHTVLPPSDPDFGRDNTTGYFDGQSWVGGDSYNYTLPSNWPADSLFVDSVAYFNQQIHDWKEILARNEREKLSATFDKNISFDAGAIYEEEQTNSETEEHTRTFSFAISPYVATEVGISVFSIGSVVNFERTYTHTITNTDGTSETHTITYGYHLEDNNAGDYLSIDVKKPTSNTGTVFITQGGQTMCPYEDAEFTHYYNPGTLISQATMQIEVPEITALNSIEADIPEDQPAIFVLNLSNASQTDDDQWLILSIDEQTNQNGAQIFLDGTPIDDGRLIMIPGGQSITKVLSIYKGLPDVYEYENIGIILHSACQFDPTDFQADISDTVFVSAYFTPVCSSVSLESPDDNWLINTATDTTLHCVLSDYDLNSQTFSKILLQYKPTSSSSWITDMVFYANEDEYNTAPPPKYFINGQTSLNYSLDFRDLQDRDYMIKATSVCTDGTINTSSILTGVKDVKPPLLFGSPQPADGILSPGDEISISFDEPIEAGALLPYNFSIRGALNSSELKHNACLYFDGVHDYAAIESKFNLNNKSWTIEFWTRRGDLGRGVIFSEDDIEIGFDSNQKFYLKIGNQIFTSQTSISNIQDWNHFAVSYDKDNNSVSMYINNIVELENAQVTTSFVANNRFFIGKSQNDDNYYNGFIHDLRIWDTNIGFSTIYANMYLNMSGNEMYLSGYWPMNKAYGNIAIDKARYHHLILFGPQWKVFPSGFAWKFDNNNSYLNIPTGSSVVIDDLNDFTIEFYFKCSPQSNTVIFSNGKGDGSDTSPGFSDIWNIGFDNSGKLYAKNNGVIMTLDSNYADNQWHHFALVCSRITNTSVYIDGELIKSEQSSLFGGLLGAEMTLGARRHNYLNNVTYDRYFNGSIDELRIWRLAKTQKQIQLDMNSKLKGDEIGLVAYYPFDTYDALGASLIESATDYATDTLNFTYNESGFDHVDVPNIKEARPVQELNYNWVVNNDKIIINLDEPLATIEKCNIEFTVDKVKDQHGNFMQSPVTWIAYINQNTLVWEDQMLSFEKEIYAPLSFTEKIINKGGTQQSYEITNLPDWLSVDNPSGTIEPNSYILLNFTVDPAVNIGNYEESIYLVGDYGYSEKLGINLKVYKTPPQWTVNANDYQYSMNIIGQIKINGKFSTNPDDIIAAFVGDQCRGVAKSTYVKEYDNYQVYMTIYSNTQYGEHLTFKVWNASEGYVHTDVTPEFDFVDNQTIGTPSNPQIFEANNNYQFSIPLFVGWNWLSFGLESSALSDLNQIMSTVNNNDGDQIKTKDAFANYSSMYGWNGPLANSGLNNVNMYMVKTSVDDTIVYSGEKIDISNIQIPINTGWNWISYIPTVNMSVNDALANYHPADGDLIKSQYNFAVYDELLGWIGNLNYMMPGKGYMFYTSNPNGYLTYPSFANKVYNNVRDYVPVTNTPWTINVHKYSDNASIVATLIKPSNISENNAIGTFVNNECRGITKPTTVDNNNYYFITSYLDKEKEQAQFKLIDFEDGHIYPIKEHITLQKNGMYGDYNNPVILTINNDSLDYDYTEMIRCNVYPNPFADKININLYLPESMEVKIEIVDIVGKTLFTNVKNDLIKGKNLITIDATKLNLKQGVYNVKVYAGSYIKTFMLIKK